MSFSASLALHDVPPADAADLTFPRYWTQWQKGAAYRAVVAGAESIEGMALMSQPFGPEDARRCRLLSISVRRPQRRRGMGLALLAGATEQARAQGAGDLFTTYSSRVRGAEALAALFVKAGWTPPRVYEIRVAGRADWALKAREDQAGFVAALEQRGFGCRPWSSLGPDDLARVAAMSAPDGPGAAFVPPTWPEATQSPYSLALTKDGAVVGWLFGEVQPDGRSVLYHTGWVLPLYQRLGWLFGGLMVVACRQTDLLGADSIGVYSTDEDNHAMRAIMERRLRPYGPLWMEHRLETSCRLAP